MICQLRFNLQKLRKLLYRTEDFDQLEMMLASRAEKPQWTNCFSINSSEMYFVRKDLTPGQGREKNQDV